MEMIMMMRLEGRAGSDQASLDWVIVLAERRRLNLPCLGKSFLILHLLLPSSCFHSLTSSDATTDGLVTKEQYELATVSMLR
jgi:hypothetical protein